MTGRDPRDEAERLVASALAKLSLAAGNTDDWATGSAECCVCPVCKAIAATREPDPAFVERLATGAGDLAAGLASVLRAFGAPATPPSSGPPPADPPGGGRTGEGDDVWRSATND